MDWNRIEGNWKQAQGRIKEKWGKLTDDDLTMINGRREQLEGIIQQRYGLARDMVRKDVDALVEESAVVSITCWSAKLSKELTSRSFGLIPRSNKFCCDRA